jgi:hypothetical protein
MASKKKGREIAQRIGTRAAQRWRCLALAMARRCAALAMAGAALRWRWRGAALAMAGAILFRIYVISSGES